MVGMRRFSTVPDLQYAPPQLSPVGSGQLSAMLNNRPVQQHPRQLPAVRPASSMSISAMLGHEGPNRDIASNQQSTPAPLQVPFASKPGPSLLPPTLSGKAQFNFGGLQYTPYRRTLTPDKTKGPMSLDLQRSPSALPPDENPMSPSRVQFGPSTPSSAAARSIPFYQANNFGGPGNPFSQGLTSIPPHGRPMMEADFRELAERQQQFDSQSIRELMRKSVAGQQHSAGVQESDQTRQIDMAPPNQYNFVKTPQFANPSLPELRPSIAFGSEVQPGLRNPDRTASWPQNPPTGDGSSGHSRHYSSPMPPNPTSNHDQAFSSQQIHATDASPRRRMSFNDDSSGVNPRRQPNPHHMAQLQLANQASASARSGPSSISNSPTNARSQLRHIMSDRNRDPNDYMYTIPSAQPAPSVGSASNASRRTSQFGPALGVNTGIAAAPGRSSPLPQAVLGAMGPDTRLHYGTGAGEGIKSEFGKMFTGIGLGRNGGISPNTPRRGSPGLKAASGEGEKLSKAQAGPVSRNVKKGVKRPKVEEANEDQDKGGSGRKKRVRSGTISKKEKEKDEEKDKENQKSRNKGKGKGKEKERERDRDREKGEGRERREKESERNGAAQDKQNISNDHHQSVESPLFGPYHNAGDFQAINGNRFQSKNNISSNQNVVLPNLSQTAVFSDFAANLLGNDGNRDSRRQIAATSRQREEMLDREGGAMRMAAGGQQYPDLTGLDAESPIRDAIIIDRVRNAMFAPRRPPPSPQPLVRPPTPRLTVKSEKVYASVRDKPSRHLGTIPYSAKLTTHYIDPPPSHFSARRLHGAMTSHSLNSSAGGRKRTLASRRSAPRHAIDPDDIEHDPSRMPYSISPNPLPRAWQSYENCTADILVHPQFLSDCWLARVRARHALWGTDVYTDDSDLLAVLMHVGLVADEALLEELLLSLPEGQTAARQDPWKAVGSSGILRRRVGEERKDGVKERRLPLPVPPGHGLRVRVRVLPRLTVYGGVVRHGIRSRSWGTSVKPDGEGRTDEPAQKVAAHDGVSFAVEGLVGFRWGMDPGWQKMEEMMKEMVEEEKEEEEKEREKGEGKKGVGLSEKGLLLLPTSDAPAAAAATAVIPAVSVGTKEIKHEQKPSIPRPEPTAAVAPAPESRTGAARRKRMEAVRRQMARLEVNMLAVDAASAEPSASGSPSAA